MKNLEDQILQACNALELHVDFSFVVDVGGGKKIQALACIRNLGAEKGMLIFRDFDNMRLYAEKLVVLGYGYSVLDEPLPGEVFNLDDFIELFRDWGWSGDIADCPAWFKIE